MEKLLQKFTSFTERRKLEVLLYGLYPDNPDLYQTNKSLKIAVHQYLISTDIKDLITSNLSFPLPHPPLPVDGIFITQLYAAFHFSYILFLKNQM